MPTSKRSFCAQLTTTIDNSYYSNLPVASKFTRGDEIFLTEQSVLTVLYRTVPDSACQFFNAIWSCKTPHMAHASKSSPDLPLCDDGSTDGAVTCWQ